MSGHTTKDGTNPAYSFNDDTDTGIGSSAANTLQVICGGTAVQTFTTAGSVFAGVVDVNGTADGLVLDADADTTISAPTDDQIDIEIAGADDFTFTANKFNVLSGSQITFATASSAAAANAVLMGGGTSGSPLASSTADDKFIEFRAKSTATSGDNRLLYMRYQLDGAAGGGECLRAFTVLSKAIGTAHGAHMSLVTTSTTGYVTGLAAGSRSTLEIADAAVPANGTYYGALAEIYCDGTSSSVAAVAKHAILSIGANGDQTGAATVLNAISFDGVSAGDTTKMVTSISLAELPTNVGIGVLVNGSRYYIPCVAVAGWN